VNKRRRTYHFFFLCLFLTGLFFSASPVSAHTLIKSKSVHELRQKRLSFTDDLHPVDMQVKPVGSSRAPFTPGDEPSGGWRHSLPVPAVTSCLSLYERNANEYGMWQQQYLQHIYPFHHHW